MSRAGFTYAQARLHARLAQRLDEADWQILESSRDFGHCLDVISRMPIAGVTAQLTRASDPHRIEQVLRQDWSDKVDEISRWLPVTWRRAGQWMKLLLYLQRADFARTQSQWPDWLDAGPGADAMLPADIETRADSFDAAGFWLHEWLARMPSAKASGEIRAALAPLLTRYLGTTDVAKPLGRAELEARLVRLFRDQRQSPVAMLAYLGLAGLDHERLRGILSARAVFDSSEFAKEA